MFQQTGFSSLLKEVNYLDPLFSDFLISILIGFKTLLRP